MEPRALFATVRRHPGMYMLDASFDQAVAFVLGVDAGNAGCLLHGFKEWLVVTFGGKANSSWITLVLQAAFPETPGAWDKASRTVEEQKVGFDLLFLLLDDFFVERNQTNGLCTIFERYAALLHERT